jgi:hypothetical protein
MKRIIKTTNPTNNTPNPTYAPTITFKNKYRSIKKIQMKNKIQR